MGIIQIKNLSYTHPDGTELLRNISFSLDRGQKIALIGPNGSGKSTLLDLIAAGGKSTSDEIYVGGSIYYVPQHFGQWDDMTLAGALGVEHKIAALGAILGGDASADNFEALKDDWLIEKRTILALEEWGLRSFGLERRVSSLSGGEKTRLFLCGIAVHDPDIVLMDEPSNHLDAESRMKLYSLIGSSRASMIVVSHDRTLLNRIETTVELDGRGVSLYGGNYEFYKQQKEAELDALQEHIDEREKSLRLARKTAIEVRQRNERDDRQGKKKAVRSGVPRIMMKTLADNAAASSKRISEEHSEKIATISKELSEFREKMPYNPGVKIKLGDSSLHEGKVLVGAEGVNFSYGGEMLWKSGLSFLIRSGERIAIEGGNGSGKTTLIKLILGESEPTSGIVSRADNLRWLYIDQEYSFIDCGRSVIEQLERHNSRNLPDHMLKTELHRFLFPADTWEKSCRQLSGGEKMRLTLCCMLVGDAAPDILVLDEPTNNLDIRSLEILRESLRGYRGTLIVVSHDAYFKFEIGVGHSIEL